MIYYQLAVNLTSVVIQITRPAQERTGTKSQPLKLGELCIDAAPHAAMPEHGEHVVSLANVEAVEVHWLMYGWNRQATKRRTDCSGAKYLPAPHQSFRRCRGT